VLSGGVVKWQSGKVAKWQSEVVEVARIYLAIWQFGNFLPPLRRTNLATVCDMEAFELAGLIRTVPDFPRAGVSFKDFTPLLRQPGALALAVELMASPFRGQGVDLVLGAESRGFIFGTAIAQALSAGFVPVRKPGKLPHATASMGYDLEYGSDRIEVHTDAVERGQRVILVDDLLATGGTLEACAKLAVQLGGQIVGMTVLIELAGLRGRDRLEAFAPVQSVIRY
jgi:adenine phosphoribosyltransferase